MSFADLDLTGVEADAGSARLQPGSYLVVCKTAKYETKEGTKNKAVVCEFVDESGHGDIRHNFNVVHSSEQAQEIGRKQLKAFLERGGHPDPDRPGDVKSLEGLKVAIFVGLGKPYTGNDGKTRQLTEIKKFMEPDTAVSGPSGAAAPAAAAASGGGGSPLDDRIPF